MATVRKDVLYVGTVHPPGLGRPIRFGADDLAHYRTRMREMLADGLQIPVSWEHQSRAVPRTREEWEEQKAELTKLTLGHVAGADVEDGALVNELDVPDDADRKRLPSIKFVSPQIKWDWTDGRGRLWPGPSITHIAVTPRPVQHDQKAFTRDSVGMSLELSLADYVNLGDPEMADEYEDLEGGGRGEEEGAEGGEGEGEGEGGETPAVPEAEQPDPQLAETLACLKRLGLVLPPDTTKKNLLERLHTAALTKEAHMGPEDMPNNEGDEGGTGGEEPTPVPAPAAGVTLSMESERRLKAAEARLIRGARVSLRERISRLAARGISRALREQMLADAGTVSLSFGDDGDLAPNALLARIEAYEALPPVRNGFAGGRDASLSHDEPTPVQAPEGDGAAGDGKPDPHVMSKLTGGRWKPAAN